MKKLLNKKNNKGFSLVELIVVVLIMGIIAVALAPQVMKWVGTSKTKTEENNKATIKSSVQVAVADAQANGWTLGAKSFAWDATGVDGIDGASGTATTGDGLLEAAVASVSGGDYSAKKSDGTTSFTVSISADGAVTVN